MLVAMRHALRVKRWVALEGATLRAEGEEAATRAKDAIRIREGRAEGAIEAIERRREHLKNAAKLLLQCREHGRAESRG